MDQLLAEALESLRENLGEVVRYQRGNNALTGSGPQVTHHLRAVIGSTEFRTVADRGATLLTRSSDFLMALEDLAFLPGGTPAEGDQIERTLGLRRETYEVVRFNSEPCWRWSDPLHTELRIHTKLLRAQTPLPK